MLCQFKNIFDFRHVYRKVNFKQLVEIRRAKVREQGFLSEDSVDWDHYAKVLEAKREALKNT